MDDEDDAYLLYAPTFGQDSSGPSTNPAITSAFLAQLAAAAAGSRTPVAVSSFQQAYNAAVSMGEVTGPLLGVTGSIDPLTSSVMSSFAGSSMGHEPLAQCLTAPLPRAYVDERVRLALIELSKKQLSTIQRETAMTWAYRAQAAVVLMQRAQAQGLHALAHHWLRDATEYAHEAVEHASLSGDDRVLHAVRRLVASALA